LPAALDRPPGSAFATLSWFGAKNIPKRCPLRLPPLWIVRLGARSRHRVDSERRAFQSGVTLRLPPHSREVRSSILIEAMCFLTT
jgi:hypothetical protein